MSKIPENLKYSTDHEWVLFDGNTATVGITDHAQDALGEIVYVELPEAESHYDTDEELASIESVKAASPVICPVSGQVMEVNRELEDSPELINQDPYGAWICKLSDVELPDTLLTAAEYKSFLGE